MIHIHSPLSFRNPAVRNPERQQKTSYVSIGKEILPTHIFFPLTFPLFFHTRSSTCTQAPYTTRGTIRWTYIRNHIYEDIFISTQSTLEGKLVMLVLLSAHDKELCGESESGKYNMCVCVENSNEKPKNCFLKCMQRLSAHRESLNIIGIRQRQQQ